MTDHVSDMLTRIRNAYAARLTEVTIPYSKMKLELAKLLSAKGVLGEVKADEKNYKIVVTLTYSGVTPALEHIGRISKPGLRVYGKARNIRRVRSGLGFVIISTSKGLMTGDEARKNKLGGEVIAEVW